MAKDRRKRSDTRKGEMGAAITPEQMKKGAQKVVKGVKAGIKDLTKAADMGRGVVETVITRIVRPGLSTTKRGRRLSKEQNEKRMTR
jgi:hypothetical protein|tara:strand:+ start:1189 stop:1449 length:261 start_codon:yes stop_codon:yes gene_type:complete